MTKYINILSMLFLLSFGSALFGHGEEQRGPHNGSIRMPGAFHTEVVALAGKQLKIYLLDMGFGTPVIDRSAVEVSLRRDGSPSINLPCVAKEDSFVCRFPDGATLDSGVLEVKATRQGAAGAKVSYKLPLN